MCLEMDLEMEVEQSCQLVRFRRILVRHDGKNTPVRQLSSKYDFRVTAEATYFEYLL